MDVTLLLCDWAEVVQGKLYAQGIGWAQTLANVPGTHAVAVLINVPYDRTNEKHELKLQLLTEDGQPYPNEPPVFPPAEFGFEFELGRPPGMKAGQSQTLPFSAKIAGVSFVPGGYTWQAFLDDEPVASVSFLAVVQPGGLG